MLKEHETIFTCAEGDIVAHAVEQNFINNIFSELRGCHVQARYRVTKLRKVFSDFEIRTEQ